MRALWKGLTPFAVHLTLKYALRMGTNATYQSLLRDKVKTYPSDVLLCTLNACVQHSDGCEADLLHTTPEHSATQLLFPRNTGCFVVHTDEGKLT